MDVIKNYVVVCENNQSDDVEESRQTKNIVPEWVFKEKEKRK